MSLEALPELRGAPTVTAAEMAEADRICVDELGIGLEMLMENASRQIAAAARALLGDVSGKRVVALAGSGNNGGDALGAIRHLRGWGAYVAGVVSSPIEKLRPLPRRQYEILRRIGIAPPDADAVDRADLLLDGLLGYSVSGPPRGSVAELIRAANTSGVPILGIDLPSGLDPDSGAPLGVAIRAAATVTLALPKRGLVAAGSRNLVGELLLADIGVPSQAFARMGIDTRRVFERGDLLRIIPA